MTRVIVYTGKGGVGKTTVAAATALLCGQRGYRTLVLSTDVAHSLNDAFGLTTRSAEPQQPVTDLPLWVQETDIHQTIRRYWGAIQDYFAKVFQWRGLDEVIAEEITFIPGLDEMVGLIEILEHYESARYDVIVVDAAPTGETIRLLALPEAARWWFDRVLPIQRRATQIAGPMLRRVTGMPMPDDAVFRAGEELFRKLEKMQQLLSNSETSSLRVVLNLERMVIAEAQRSFTCFNLFGYTTDLIVCNRVLPADSGPYFANWRRQQVAYRAEVTAAFEPVPVRAAALLAREVVGLDMLIELGTNLFESADPSQFFSRRRPYRIDRENGGYALYVELPFVELSDINIQRSAEELVLQVGRWRRNVVLPRALADLPTGDAKLTDHVVRIEFPSSVVRGEV